MPRTTKLHRKLSVEDRAEFDRHLRERRMTYDEVIAWLATRGCRASLVAVRGYAIAEGFRPANARRFMRLDRMLSPADRPAYEALLTDPRTSVPDARAWLAARGYAMSATSVSAHRKRFEESLDGLRDTARLAASIAQIAREQGEVALSDGMLTRFEQVMLEQLSRPAGVEGPPIPAKDLAEMSKSVAAAVGSRERFETMRREFEEAKVKAAEEAESAAKGGATGRQVVERVREILGMPPLPAPAPARAAAPTG
jgi:hypothetical protein